MKDRNDIDVLICGAGAAGLALAIDLARRGVSFRLIEKLDAPFAGSRGKGIQPRTQEVFDDLGLIDAVTAIGGTYPPHRYHRADGSVEETQDIVFSPPTVAEPYRSMLLVPQFGTESVMRARLASLGAAPEFAHELLSFEQDDRGVTARIATPAGEEIVRCGYLIAADGGRSFIRETLALGFPGQSLGVRAMVADLRLDGLSRDGWQWFNHGDRARQICFCPLPHTDLFQLQAPIPAEGDFDLSLPGIQAFIDTRVPPGTVTVRGISWASAYNMSARLSDHYRVDRILLIGDAAHIHPPTGAQGLNTSVQDAYNLGWKLGAVLNGAPAELLDTYEEERRPIAATMLGLATEMLDRATSGNLRRGREVNQLDLHYGWSSLGLATGHDGAVVAGDRAPDAVLHDADGRPVRLFDLLRGPHWTLIGYDLRTADLPVANDALHVHHVAPQGDHRDPDGAMAATFGLKPGDWLLVRPDGYVAAIAGSADRPAVLAYLARWRLAA